MNVIVSGDSVIFYDSLSSCSWNSVCIHVQFDFLFLSLSRSLTLSLSLSLYLSCGLDIIQLKISWGAIKTLITFPLRLMFRPKLKSEEPNEAHRNQSLILILRLDTMKFFTRLDDQIESFNI